MSSLSKDVAFVLIKSSMSFDMNNWYGRVDRLVCGIDHEASESVHCNTVVMVFTALLTAALLAASISTTASRADVNPHLRGRRVENHLGKTTPVHTTEIRTSISPSSAAELKRQAPVPPFSSPILSLLGPSDRVVGPQISPQGAYYSGRNSPITRASTELPLFGGFSTRRAAGN
uniref:Uncharacterized protein n=1 Tax=Timema cristinae TaxID=61476 RepID=A0A7R9GS58_TIMCR|nr:unnamed protein product [Timema cristinae]